MDKESKFGDSEVCLVRVMSKKQSKTWGPGLPKVKPMPLTPSHRCSVKTPALALSELGKTSLTAGTLLFHSPYPEARTP